MVVLLLLMNLELGDISIQVMSRRRHSESRSRECGVWWRRYSNSIMMTSFLRLVARLEVIFLAVWWSDPKKRHESWREIICLTALRSGFHPHWKGLLYREHDDTEGDLRQLKWLVTRVFKTTHTRVINCDNGIWIKLAGAFDGITKKHRESTNFPRQLPPAAAAASFQKSIKASLSTCEG